MKQNQFRTKTFKTGQIIIFDKRNKMTSTFFVFDVIIASSFCHYDAITMS